MSNTFVILCAYPSRHLHKLGSVSLLKYKKKRVIDHQVESIRSISPNGHIILVTGYDNINVGKYLYHKSYKNLSVVYNRCFENTNQSDSLNLAFNIVNKSNLWIISGDIVFSKTALYMADDKNPCVMYEDQNRIGDTKLGVRDDESRLTSLDYGFEKKWAHITYIPVYSFDQFKTSCKENLFMYEVINSFNSDERFDTYRHGKSSVIEICEKGQV